ncbi:MAG TPA: gamma-glutamyl-phosphate reductase, partial [Usitatibacteraceae bacterium]|nr:gamma-glutamyl-phosphate reductase [Usitatibacteraceae bacterium]
MNDMNDSTAANDVRALIASLGQLARDASRELARAGTAAKNHALEAAADSLVDREKTILAANARDVKAARAEGADDAFVDRLKLTGKAVEEMAEGLRQVAKLPDPVGEITELRFRPSGIQVGRMRVPLGVVGIIYESRPDVTADAGGLCV